MRSSAYRILVVRKDSVKDDQLHLALQRRLTQVVPEGVSSTVEMVYGKTEAIRLMSRRDFDLLIIDYYLEGEGQLKGWSRTAGDVISALEIRQRKARVIILTDPSDRRVLNKPGRHIYRSLGNDGNTFHEVISLAVQLAADALQHGKAS